MINEGKGVKSPYGDHLWLDIRHLGEQHIRTKLREVDEICQNFLGIDPVTNLIPVRPTQHYTMGGVRTDKDGAAYGLQGLYSAGEASCWDMHGYNRLGGNSLAETVVAGMIVGEKIVEFLKGYDVAFPTSVIRDRVARDQDRIKRLISGADGSEDVYKVRSAMQDILMDWVGIFRNGTDLQKAVDGLQEVLERSKKVGLRSNGLGGGNAELASALKVEGQVKIALMMAYGGLMRTESRGCHTRSDFPARNDRDWLNRTLAIWEADKTLPTLTYEPASPTMEIPPGDRGYGKSEIIPADAPVPAPVEA